jgi:hypothetical protein
MTGFIPNIRLHQTETDEPLTDWWSARRRSHNYWYHHVEADHVQDGLVGHGSSDQATSTVSPAPRSSPTGLGSTGADALIFQARRRDSAAAHLAVRVEIQYASSRPRR